MAERIHQAIRAVTRLYPFRTPAHFFNRCMGKLFDRSEPVWIRTPAYAGHPAMELNVSTPFQRKIFYFPRAYARFWYGLPFAAYMRSVLEPGGTFVDIGSNVGYYSHLAARQVGPTGRVIAFEPDPLTHEALQRSSALNELSHMTCVNTGLSNWTGEAEFFRTEGTAHSLLDATEGDARFFDKTRIRVTSLDAWMQASEDAPARIDLIKIDVEGEEPRAVAGMRETLVTMGHPPLWIEVRGPRGSTRAPDTFAQVYETLGDLGYRAFLWNKDRPREVSVADVVKREDVLFERP